MRKPGMHLSALILGLAAFPLPLFAASQSSAPATPDGPLQLAFTLDEMNCFSSDIHARAERPDINADKRAETLLAGESGGGTNSIPCPHRDPKSPPAWRTRS